MKMSYSYFYLPNSLVESKMLPSDFSVAAFLYSMYQAYGYDSLLGCCVKIKQKTIAEACHISTESVPRAISRLEKAGIIIGKERKLKTNRHLGTYTYTLKKPTGGYFRMNRIAIRNLTPKELRCYAMFCKLRGNSTNMFFHSYSDLAKMLGLKRSEVIFLVGRLLSMKLIHKRHQITAVGDYGENRYYLYAYMKGRIVKRSKKLTAVHHQQQPKNLCQFEYIQLLSVYSIFSALSRGFCNKNKKFYFIRGRGNFDESFLKPT